MYKGETEDSDEEELPEIRVKGETIMKRRNFLKNVAAATAGTMILPNIGAKHSQVKEKRRLVLCNDGGTLGAPDMEAPIGIEGLIRETIDPLRDTMVDTLYWQQDVSH